MGDELPQKCNLKIGLVGLEKESPIDEEIYSIPTCLPTHPRYSFIIKKYKCGGSRRDFWDFRGAEIDLSVPGPIKGISTFFNSDGWDLSPYRSSYTCSDDDLFLTYPSVYGHIRDAVPINIRFLRIGRPAGYWREVNVEGVDKMRVSGLHVDKHAGYIIAWVKENRLLGTRESSFIWWINERKAEYSSVMDLISGWNRRLLWGIGRT